VTLVVGPEELLAERAVSAVLAAARRVDPDVQVRDLVGSEIESGALALAVSPTLFGGRSVVVVRGIAELRADVQRELESLLADPGDEQHLVLVSAGGVKGKAVLDAARRAGAREVECAKVTRLGDLTAFVRDEVRVGGRSITDGAIRALLDTIGRDLRDLSQAASQLLADVEGPIDEAAVRRYYQGRAEATSFSVADAAVDGKTSDALEQLRWALSVGVAPVLVTSALAQGLRGLARLAGAPRGMRQADLARELAIPPWKVDRVRRQLRGWSGDGVAAALQAVARADAEVKGAGDDAGYALERMVVAVTAARTGNRG
jgi:DNA polymerase III subunit delta